MIKNASILRELTITAVVAVFSFLLLSLTPNPFPLTSDECFSLYHAQFPVPTIWKELSRGNNPPLFETLLHFWIQLFGNSESAVRTLPTILVAMSAALIWRTSRKLYSAHLPSILAWLFFIGSNTVLLFAHEIRAYGLLLLLTVIVQSLWLIPENRKSTIHKLAWIISSAALVYTHFFGFWVLLVQGVFDLIRYVKHRNSRSFISDFAPWLLLLLIYLPYLRILIVRFLDSASSGTWMDPAPWEGPYLTLWKFTNVPIAVFPTLLLLILSVNSLLKNRTIETVNPTKSQPYLIAAFAVPFFCMWLISLPSPLCIPMFNERYSSFVIPSLAIVLAGQVNLTKTKPLVSLKNLGILSLWLLLLIGQYSFRTISVNQNIDVKSIATSMKKSTSAAIILEPDHAAFQWLYYTNPEKFKQWRSDSIYHHMAQQLIQQHVYILKTENSLDSFGLASTDSLYYVHLDNRKTKHTLMIENLIRKKFTINTDFISIPNAAPIRFKSKTTEFWKIQNNEG